MPNIAIEIVIDAPASFVWSDIADIASHAEWMSDAAEIRFLGDQTRGVGTCFVCDTVVGPFRTSDIMEVTEWAEGQAMGVRHDGLVRGDGLFTLTPRGSATIFAWIERLDFPWHLGGPLGAFVGRPVLRAIWRRNLRRLKRRIEDQFAQHSVASDGD